MTQFFSKYEEHAYALLRIIAGALFLAHGIHKFFNFPVDFPYPLNPMLTAAGVIEIVTGVLIIVGFFTRPAAFIASGMSAVGYWMMHGNQGFFPLANGGETIALYAFIFLFIAAKGPGIWSLSKSS